MRTFLLRRNNDGKRRLVCNSGALERGGGCSFEKTGAFFESLGG
jgi:hypothetical protein